MAWFWYFFIYSILGCGLEMLFTLARTGRLESRKCQLLLPVCPVYGIGALAIIYLVLPFTQQPLVIIGLSAALATAAEYLFSLYYRKVAAALFWDYSRLRFNLGGHICLTFSLAWGLLAWLLISRLQPVLTPVASAIPIWLSYGMMALFLADFLYSTKLLRQKNDKSCLALFPPVQLWAKWQYRARQ